MEDDAALIEQLRAAVDRRLAELLPDRDARPGRLADAARYAAMAPGKRFRPMLTLLAAREFGADPAVALDAACAFEMVHAASLILDDLPSMDDAALRRGRATTHREFDEATAILAAVGLLNHAFGVVAGDERLPQATRGELSRRLSEAVGFEGLVSGQAMDLHDRDRARVADDIDLLNHRKTGVLIVAAAEAGALVAGASASAVPQIGEFARRIGLAFQIQDDLIDASAIVETGKDLGKDAGMATIVSVLGVAGAQAAVEEHLEAAQAALAAAGAKGLLARYAFGLFEARKAAA
ncbi:MAG: polyprenyl synthetase family protein [Caulobacter sp.]|jgi:geranylgeranyl diphosphate synthase type II|nr:polyprenyl synthetase family protein [Caulobacter sp.]